MVIMEKTHMAGESDEFEEVFERVTPDLNPDRPQSSDRKDEEFLKIVLADLSGKHTEMKLVLYRHKL